jgi:hypothetical protein
MTDDDFPQGLEPAVLAAAEEPLDAVDAAVLREVALLLEQVDPVPVDLVDRVQFALALDEVYAEVARISRLSQDALAVRSDPDTAARTETVTFSAERFTAMVTVSRAAPEQVRLDGWLTPAAVVRVRVRMQEGTAETVSDETGRFVVEGLPEGFAQLTFEPVGAGGPTQEGPGGTVVTPLFQL